MSTCQAEWLHDFAKRKGGVRPGTSEARNYNFTKMSSSAPSVKSYSLLLVLVVFLSLAYMILILNSAQKSVHANEKRTFKMSQRETVLVDVALAREVLNFMQSLFVCLSLITVAVLISCHLLWACERCRTELFTFNPCSLCWVSCSIGHRCRVRSLQEFGASFTSLPFGKYYEYIQAF